MERMPTPKISTEMPEIKAITYSSDMGACALYTCQQPHKYLIRYGVHTDYTPFMPSLSNMPGPNQNALVQQMSRYDLVFSQRVTSLELMQRLYNACHLLQKPLIHIVDDDYINLIPSNPCYYGTAIDNPIKDQYLVALHSGDMETASALQPQLDQMRLVGLHEYKRALSLPDAIIVTTEELKQTLAPYNKNIHVFPNQVERVYYETDHRYEETQVNPETGEIKLKEYNYFGCVSVPSFFPQRDAKGELVVGAQGATKLTRIPRIGYTGTTTHHEDFESIRDAWDNVIEKLGPQIRVVYIGDPYFWSIQKNHNHKGRSIHIREAPYDTYILNVRNIDIGVAPLEPTAFNMSKSDIKAIEYASWGAAPLLPRYITYSRFWKDGDTCLMYSNQKEFEAQATRLLTEPGLREYIGNRARNYVASCRLEHQHSKRRYDLYMEILASKHPRKQVKPNKEKVNA